MKPTTKVCSNCGSTSLCHLRSLNLKQCGVCGTRMPWFLEEGQLPLIGPSRNVKAKKKTEG